MDIDLGSEISYKVKYKDAEYVLREPTVKDVSRLSSAQDKSPEDQFSVFTEFVVGLGLPREVAESLGITKVKKLADSLVSDISGKK